MLYKDNASTWEGQHSQAEKTAGMPYNRKGSVKYPNLRIEVTSEILPDVKVTGKSNFVIQNGQYVE